MLRQEDGWKPQPWSEKSLIQFAALTGAGDVKKMWDPNNPVEVEDARRSFNDLRAKGYLAFKVIDEKGNKGEQIREFDPKAGRVILTPPLQGG